MGSFLRINWTVPNTVKMWAHNKNVSFNGKLKFFFINYVRYLLMCNFDYVFNVVLFSIIVFRIAFKSVDLTIYYSWYICLGYHLGYWVSLVGSISWLCNGRRTVEIIEHCEITTTKHIYEMHKQVYYLFTAFSYPLTYTSSKIFSHSFGFSIIL